MTPPAAAADPTAEPTVSIIDACEDPALFGRWFPNRATWAAWFTFMAVLFGLPLSPEQAALYRQCTGRTEPPTKAFTEGWLICGRRAGKSFVLALIAVFLACFKSYANCLAPGERATIVVVATDKRQARTIYRYISRIDQPHAASQHTA